MRERIYDMAKRLPQIFGELQSSLSEDFHIFFSETWITEKDYYELDDEGIKQKIGEGIGNLLKIKGQKMVKALKELPQL